MQPSSPSIFSILESWTGPGEANLPDEPEGGIRWAHGAQDGVRSHHMGSMEEAREADLVYRLVDLLKSASEDESLREELYSFCQTEPMLGLVDPLMDELERRDVAGWPGLRELARWLVMRSQHREPLKLGLALLGLVGQPSDLDILEVIAEHDEFTLFAAVAGARLSSDPVGFWWRLARRVKGWGKIHLVERLAEHAEDRPDLRRWLLEDGCDNWVMPEYLAFLCATSGELHLAMRELHPSQRLLDGACLILGSLLEGGPVEDIDDYAEGPEVAERLIGHLERRASLEQLDFVARLEEWLTTDGDAWEGRAAMGWTAGFREGLQARCAALLARPGWREQVVSAYDSEDQRLRQVAWNLSQRLSVDLWETGFQRLMEATSLDAFLYWALLERGDTERRRRVLDWAEQKLPLDEIASGPKDRFGPGMEHTCLQFCLQFVSPEEFRPSLLAAGLRSPAVQARGLALGTLEKTPVDRWGVAVEQALRATALDEVLPEFRQRAVALVERLP